MPRYRQDPVTNKMIPIDEAAARAAPGVYLHGDIESFISPVDGSVITDRRQLREHNKRNNVVNADEFTPEFYADAAKKRSDHYQGKTSRKETQARREVINEIIERQQRHGQQRRTHYHESESGSCLGMGND